MMRRNPGRLQASLLMAATIALFSPSTQALDVDTVDRLVSFYAAMNGDEWRNNDGWMNPDVDPCDWYGIQCFTNDQGEPYIHEIRLTDNNLRGSLASSGILALSMHGLHLSNNLIEGNLPYLPETNLLELANNRLSGPLPEANGPAPGNWSLLDLSGNDFEGEIPASWANLALNILNLADNRLEGPPQTAFLALSEGAIAQQVFLENNHFSGELPPWITDANLFGQNSLNLCWNALTINDEELREWVQMRHVGGPDLSCLERNRRLPSPTLSGSWFYPPRAGEGFSLMLLDNDTALLYWFSHISRGRQKWLFQVAEIEEESLIFDRMYRTRGIFDQGFGDQGEFWTNGSRLRLDWLDSGLLHGEYVIQHTWQDVLREGDVIGTPPPLPPRVSRQDHERLTRLAGSHCDNPHPMQWASGAWFNEARGGEGFVVEVNEDGRGLVYWFSHTPADAHNANQQAWMIGDGHFEGQQLIIPNLAQPRDLGDAMPEDTDGIEVLLWGSLSIDFHDPDSAELQFDSELDDYGSGQYPLVRLARARLAECPED